MSPSSDGRAKWLFKVAVGVAALLHLIQLPLYPVTSKWYAALVGGLIYTLSALAIHRGRRFAFALATYVPVMAGLFVTWVLLTGWQPPSGDLEFNPFTAAAALVEAPMVVLGLYLRRTGQWPTSSWFLPGKA